MSNGFMLYRCDFEKINPIHNQHWFYHSFENAMEKFRSILENDVLPNYNNSSQYDIFNYKKEQMIDGCCRLLFQSDDEMIWLEAIHFSDK
jgi:hypothetical protein